MATTTGSARTRLRLATLCGLVLASCGSSAAPDGAEAPAATAPPSSDAAAPLTAPMQMRDGILRSLQQQNAAARDRARQLDALDRPGGPGR